MTKTLNNKVASLHTSNIMNIRMKYFKISIEFWRSGFLFLRCVPRVLTPSKGVCWAVSRVLMKDILHIQRKYGIPLNRCKSMVLNFTPPYYVYIYEITVYYCNTVRVNVFNLTPFLLCVCLQRRIFYTQWSLAFNGDITFLLFGTCNCSLFFVSRVYAVISFEICCTVTDQNNNLLWFCRNEFEDKSGITRKPSQINK